MVEWALLAAVIRDPQYRSLDLIGFLQDVLHPRKESYPNMARLAAIGVTLPMTSVNCERGISGYNAIKTDARNVLSVEHTDNLMQLYLESTELEMFDFDKAFRLWTQVKDRRGLSCMVKTAKVTT